MVKNRWFLWSLAIAGVALLLITGCSPGTTATTPSLTTTTTPPAAYTVPQLKYLLIAKYPNLFWCDPDYYPLGRPGQEQQNALQQFPAIQADEEEFAAILHQLNLSVSDSYSDEGKLLIYRQHKLLNGALELTGSSSPYDYTLRTGENQGYKVTGTITANGVIKEMTVEVSFNTCPICLPTGTIIETPVGPIPVQDLRQGMLVWTRDESGQKIEAMILKTVRTPVPQGFQLVKINLADGRSVTASPGHPSADFKALGDYNEGDILDGTKVASIERIAYSGAYTYDILPAGTTGTYWADGVLLKSTIND